MEILWEFYYGLIAVHIKKHVTVKVNSFKLKVSTLYTSNDIFTIPAVNTISIYQGIL